MSSSSLSSYSILPWKTRIAVNFLSLLTDTARRQDGTVNRRLLKVVDFRSSTTPRPFKGVKSLDVNVDTCRNLWFRLYVPTTTTNEGTLPVIVFFHGGGFTFLSAASKAYDIVCRRFARKLSAVVVSLDYRLTPEHRFPCQYDDGFDVLSFLDRHQHVLPENADVSKCFLAGDSAGANICHHVAVRATQAKFERVKVVGLISIQPFFGGEERTEAELRLTNSPLVSLDRTDWAWRIFLPDESNRDHWAANVSGPNAIDISGLEYPETMVVVGGHDPLQDWQRRYCEWLKRSGKEASLVEYPNSIHGFYVFPELPESALLIADIQHFVHKCLSKPQQKQRPHNGNL